jgi:SAM-dependent methyltransferase
MDSSAERASELEAIPCIFGHGFNDEVAIEENGFKGRRCHTCGLIYISPRPRREDVFDLYHHDKAHLPAVHHIQEKPTATMAAAHHLRILRQLRPAPASLLEIGCGGGHFLQAAREAGYEAHGIELNPSQAEYVRGKRGIPCETAPFSERSFGGKKFDVIYHVDVTSHLPDPIGDFSSMLRKLGPGGVLFFETGNGADIDPQFYKYFSVFQYPDHLFFFGENTVRELLVRAGFHRDFIEIRRYSILPTLKFTAFLQQRRSRHPSTVSAAIPSTQASNHAAVASRGEVIKAKIFHHLKYSLGRWTARRSHPMTFLVAAKKAA